MVRQRLIDRIAASKRLKVTDREELADAVITGWAASEQTLTGGGYDAGVHLMLVTKQLHELWRGDGNSGRSSVHWQG
jgi:hypothetical protein